MLIKDNKILECTELELFDYYLSRNFDELYSFEDYKKIMKSKGVKII